MPIFEFQCNTCGEVFDDIFSKEPDTSELPKCPKCKNESKKIEIPGCSFELKGGGWSAHNYSKTPFKKSNKPDNK